MLPSLSSSSVQKSPWSLWWNYTVTVTGLNKSDAATMVPAKEWRDAELHFGKEIGHNKEVDRLHNVK